VKLRRTELPEVLLIEPDVFRDPRGYFLEAYHQGKYAEAGLAATFVQDNCSRSTRGILRGLHAQLRRPQGKLVRVVEGEIFDVAVDIRVGSPTFGRWVGATLSSQNFLQIYVPPGFAHGFAVVSETAHVEYKCTDFYDAPDEISLLWSDPKVGVRWPITDPILSKKDAAGLPLAELAPRLPKYPNAAVV
jgi:dTDP-4-dehydrorhamnose 3,5-epimerase